MTGQTRRIRDTAKRNSLIARIDARQRAHRNAEGLRRDLIKLTAAIIRRELRDERRAS